MTNTRCDRSAPSFPGEGVSPKPAATAATTEITTEATPNWGRSQRGALHAAGVAVLAALGVRAVAAKSGPARGASHRQGDGHSHGTRGKRGKADPGGPAGSPGSPGNKGDNWGQGEKGDTGVPGQSGPAGPVSSIVQSVSVPLDRFFGTTVLVVAPCADGRPLLGGGFDYDPGAPDAGKTVKVVTAVPDAYARTYSVRFRRTTTAGFPSVVVAYAVCGPLP
jgi:hypothetical protein